MKSLLGVNQICGSINNAAGLDLTVNQGRKQQQKDTGLRLKSICEAICRPFSGAVPAVPGQHPNDGNL